MDIYHLGCLFFIELFGRQRVWLDLDGRDIVKVLGSHDNPLEGPETNHLPHAIRGLVLKAH